MQYVQLTKTDGSRITVPTQSIIYVQENKLNSTLYAGLATIHVAETYQDIVDMIDRLP